MYCIKCGVELSDGKKPCPLCGTVPYHPDVEGAASEPTYPPYVKPEKKIKKSLIMILLTVIYGLTAAELALCDFIISARLGLLLYIQRPQPSKSGRLWMRLSLSASFKS